MGQVHYFKRIAYLGLVPGHKGFEDRFRGDQEGLRKYGLTFDKGFVRPWLLWVPKVDGVYRVQLLDK